MDRRLRAFLLCVNAAGLSLAAYSLASDGLSISAQFLILAVISAIVSPHSVRIGLRMEIFAGDQRIVTSPVRDISIEPRALATTH